MKNKIKYIIFLTLFSLLLIIPISKVDAVDAVVTKIEVAPSVIGLKPGLLSPVTVTVSVTPDPIPDIFEVVFTVSEDDPNNVIATPIVEKCVKANFVEYKCNKTVNIQALSGDIEGQARVVFQGSGKGSNVLTISVNETGTPPVVEAAGLGDYCDATRNCEPASNIVCTLCSDKTGLTCAKPKVCLGDAGFTPCKAPVTGDSATVSGNNACGASLICSEDDQCVNDFGGASLGDLGIGKATTDIRDQIRSFINIALGFLGVAGAIIVLYGGVLWMTARGNDEQVTKAKSTIVSGVVGIIIILLAWTIVSYVLKLGGQITT